MFKKVLVPLDGSKSAERALPFAARLAKLFGSKIILFRCAEARIIAGDEYSVPIPRVKKHEIARTRTYLNGVESKWRKRLGKTRIIVSFGNPYEEIVACAKGEKTNLILMGSHGRSGIERWILGSVSEKVLRSTHTAMLIVQTGKKAKLSSAIMAKWPAHILLPLDGSKTAEKIFNPLGDFLNALDNDLSLLHVVEGDENIPMARAYLDNMAERFEKKNVPVKNILLRQGHPAEEILKTSTRRTVDLIAMSTHGRSGFNRYFLGSVAETTLRHTNIPLLLVKAR